MVRAANEDDYRDSNGLLQAEGYQWRNAGHGCRRTPITDPDAGAPGGFVYQRNGGLIVRRRVELYEGDRLVRFSTKKRDGRLLTPEDHLNSPWWMNEDRFFLLLDRARTAGVGLVEMARRQLALPSDWTDCDIMVAARPRPGITLAAHAGPGRSAEFRGERRVIARDYDSKFAAMHFIDQLYVPGLGRKPWLFRPPANVATLWLKFEGLFDPNARGFNP